MIENGINFDYTAMTEEEAQKARLSLLDDGYYRARVLVSDAKMSKNMNPLADMLLHVFDKEGKAHEVRDFLIFTDKMMWKTKHFCDSAKLEKEFKEKKFTPALALDRNVIVKISTQEGKEIPVDKLQGKPVGTRYPDRNVVDDYVLDEVKGLVKHDGSVIDKSLNDEIPF